MTVYFWVCLLLIALCFEAPAEIRDGTQYGEVSSTTTADDKSGPKNSDKEEQSESPASQESTIKPDPEADPNVLDEEQPITEEIISVNAQKQESADPLEEVLRLEKEKGVYMSKMAEHCVEIAKKTEELVCSMGIVPTKSVSGRIYAANKNQFGNESNRELCDYPNISKEEAQAISDSQKSAE